MKYTRLEDANLAIEMYHRAGVKQQRDNAALLSRAEKAEKERDKLREALADLVDGLDANTEEREGLTEDQWDVRVKIARAAIRVLRVLSKDPIDVTQLSHALSAAHKVAERNSKREGRESK